ncbi:MAG: hypothetical protein KAI84_03155, partial [Gammaproteobacteria bacterium]|nr:hypothetical protein [Gammaproteobacteria bacterium]
MNKKITLIGSSLLLLVSSISYAEDVTEMQQTQTQTQLQNRLQTMNDEERALYKNLTENGEASNANKNRYR